MSQRDRSLLLIGGVAAALLLAGCYHYREFFVDDAFISLRYAIRFAGGGGLTWNDGERVEGYSNLLWVVACAALGWLGVDLFTAARILGVLASLGIVTPILWAHRRRTTWLPAVAVPTWILVLSTTLPAWAMGGLEQPLMTCLVTWSVVLLMPRPLGAPESDRVLFGASALLGLVTLSRPDGILLAGAVVLGASLRALPVPIRLSRAICLASLPVACLLGQLAFRLAYYGDWVPNTARAKVVLSSAHLEAGARYVLGGLASLAPAVIALPGACVIARDRERRPVLALFLVPAGTWLAYLAVIGGDIFPGHRQLLPVLALSALCGIEILDVSRVRRWVPATGAASLLASVLLQFVSPDNVDFDWHRWVWAGTRTGEFLHSAFGRTRPLLAVDAAGAVPFYSGLPAVDMLGLTDSWLAHHPPADFGSGLSGHELGNGAYVLSRHPDIVMANIPPGGEFFFRSGVELNGMDAFHRDYRLVFIDASSAEPLLLRLWIRQDSPRIGIRHSANQIVIPGMFLARGHKAPASLDETGALSTLMSAGREVHLTGIAVPKGRWAVDADVTGQIALAVVPHDDTKAAEAHDPLVLSLADDSSDVDIGVRATSEARVRSVTLTREGTVPQ